MRAALQDTLLAQRGGLIGWVPVCLAIGIGAYFSLPEEPGRDVVGAVWAIAAALFVCARWITPAIAPFAIGIALVLAGGGVAQWRTGAVAEPVLGFRYYGPIQGRVVNIDRSASDAPRLTLDQVVLSRMSPARTPARVRVSVHGDQVVTTYKAGETLVLTGHLSPPAGPAEPGGFDFQRHAWFLGLGAVGYTRTPVLRLYAPDQGSLQMRIFAIRMQLSSFVQTAIPGDPGAFAAAIMTGDRSAMRQETLADLRAANLAHLLAISGLHMGLLTGFIFALIRYGLALSATISLRFHTKKIAAICALIVGAFYLALSGGNVATERAFIMVAVMLVAVLLDRRALTLRAVAIAAIIVLLWQPEALMGPGFQMSFAATTALVAVFGWLRQFDMSGWPKWVRGVFSVVISSFVAGLATAPFAAAHFNQIAHFGLIANLASVPLMGVLVMPAAVMAICLAPAGLSWIGFTVMAWGLQWILWVAQTVSGWDGAVGHVIAPSSGVVPLLALGLLWIILWQGRGRAIGIVPVVVSFLLWGQATRPTLLVADNAAMIGVMGSEGRALSKSKGSSFIAQIWLENDGGPAPQEMAASRPGYTRDGRIVRAHVGEWQVLQVTGKTALAALHGCGGADVLISNQEDVSGRPCITFDINRLRQTGALAFDLSDAGDLRLTTAQGVVGNRLWNANADAAPTSEILLHAP
ncbi:competence protein [Loktanella sp. D2R18]|uniref:ComEC/Rec2 family competence protein n=1 Tax=Rhodobacterales TaxID=204455 RepID=UPI000DEA4C82|nr:MULTISPECIES: ComEC/Rec2 family competence protein [Rhodobacterales]MDO6590639.1 ComEC/Rec2 family competence protein [Yoonia sp. 1_MG-2023]RBW44735.1 competence protein [Loktanella sp. D2R18]